MPHNHDHAVEVLNRLIKTTLDSVSGYRDAAHAIDDPHSKTLFNDRAALRAQLATNLQQHVQSLGGDPQTEQGVVGKIHNKFVELKSAIAGGSDKAVVDEVERGESHIKERFEEVLDDRELPADVLSVVRQAYQGIKADYEEVSSLKRVLH